MKRNSLLIVLLIAIIFTLIPEFSNACTVAVISGKATPDGRPLLWKNRDTGHKANKVLFFKGEKYNYIAVVNSEDKEPEKIWSGVNSAGFCIMNSLSYNLNFDEKSKEMSKEEKEALITEGKMMKLALEQCATISDFEQLLVETVGKRNVQANFGVIDAEGGAAFLETDNQTHRRFDADDPALAPEGYIVRTNFSNSGEPNKGAGYIRYDRCSKLFHEEVSGGGISPEWLLMSASRDMVNNLTGIDPLAQLLPAHSRDRRLFYMNDSLARPTATSTTLFQGIKAGEDPARTIMWTRLGHPLCSVSIPLWESGGESMKIVTGEKNAPIDDLALQLHSRIYPFSGGSRDKYLDLAPLVNAAGDGILQRLISIEERILSDTQRLISESEQFGADRAALIQSEMENLAAELLREAFPDVAEKAGISGK